MTKPKRPTVRLFVEEELREGQALVLSEGPSHYLRTVLRKSEGAVVGLFNGQSPEFAATHLEREPDEIGPVIAHHVKQQLGLNGRSHTPRVTRCTAGPVAMLACFIGIEQGRRRPSQKRQPEEGKYF